MKQFDREEHERVNFEQIPAADVIKLLEMIVQQLGVILVVERYESNRYGTPYRFVSGDEVQKP